MDETFPTEWLRQLLDPDNLTIVPLPKSTNREWRQSVWALELKVFSDLLSLLSSQTVNHAERAKYSTVFAVLYY